MKFLSNILKGLITTAIFIIAFISMIYSKDPQGVWTAIWCLSLVTLVDMISK